MIYNVGIYLRLSKEDNEIGEYISALSNGAAYSGKEKGYLVWGIKDSTHEIVGTNFDPDCNTAHNEPLKHYLERLLSPNVKIDFEETFINNIRLVVLTISAAKNIPTAWDGVRYIRVGSSKEKLSKFPEREIHLFHILRDGIPTIVNTKSLYIRDMGRYTLEEAIKERDTLFTREVRLFTAQCLRQLELDEYDEGERIGVSVAVLYRLHEVWCEIHGIGCMTRKAFTIQMQSLGYYKDKGKCLVKSCAAGQAKDKQQIIYHYVPRIEDMSLQEQVKKRIHEKLTEGYWSLNSAEYQQLYALFVWFDE